MTTTTPRQKAAESYARALGIAANPDLRDHLTSLYVDGEADAESLEVIPVLAGRLSADEQQAIATTLSQVKHEPNPSLDKYIATGEAARNEHVQAWNREGARTVRAVGGSVVVSAIAAVIGTATAGLTGDWGLAMWGPFLGTAGATLSTVYGYSRAGVVDENIRSYGVHD